MNEASEVISMIKSNQERHELTLTPEQKELVRRQCMPPNSSDDEFALFLHVAQQKGMDPLQREIHCTKVGGRLQFIMDINGLQGRAAREPDYRGIDQAVVYEKDEFLVDQKTCEVTKHLSNPFSAGKPVGAWAVVTRLNMRPFRSMVKFSEYDNPHNPLWKTKPSVMIEKVAKSVALRLAYPVQLGGIYERAELDKAEREEKEVNHPPSQGLAAIPTKALAAPQQRIADAQLALWDDQQLRDKIMENEAWLEKAKKDDPRKADVADKVTRLTNELLARERNEPKAPPSDDGIPFGVEP